jgi:hypothetical protein
MNVQSGLLPGKPINKCSAYWGLVYCVSTPHSNYQHCRGSTWRIEIVATFILLSVCDCRSPQSVFCNSDLLQRAYKHVLVTRFHTLCHRKVIYTEAVILERKTYMSVSARDNIGRLTWLAWAACSTLTNHV